MRNLFLVSVALGIFVLPGCAVTQAGLKSDDGRTVVRSIQDINAARTIRARMMRAHGFDLGGVDVEVREGIALLSGRVPRVEDRIEAERIAWSAPEVDRIGNEIVLGDKQGVLRNAKDGVLEKTVRTRLIADGHVHARNLNIETHEGVVYMLGMVDSLEERERATALASTTRGVREVVSYIKLRGEDPAETSAYAANPQPLPAPERAAAPAFELPDEVVTAAPIVPQGAPEPFYRDPETGERIELPSGTEVIPQTAPPTSPQGVPIPPDAGQGAPFYIDPDSGARIPVRYDTIR